MTIKLTPGLRRGTRAETILKKLQDSEGDVWGGDFGPLSDLDKWRVAFKRLEHKGIVQSYQNPDRAGNTIG